MILLVALAAYTLVVSVVYALLYAVSPPTANALLILFVALLLVPACAQEAHRARRRR